MSGLAVMHACCCKPEAPDCIVGFTLCLGSTPHREDSSCVQRMAQDKQDGLPGAER